MIVLIVMVMVSRSAQAGRKAPRQTLAPRQVRSPPADVPEDDVKVYIPTRKAARGAAEAFARQARQTRDRRAN